MWGGVRVDKNEELKFFGKIQTFFFFFGGGGGGGDRVVGGGVREDMNEELKFL